jgi:hypothetical protein
LFCSAPDLPEPDAATNCIGILRFFHFIIRDGPGLAASRREEPQVFLFFKRMQSKVQTVPYPLQREASAKALIDLLPPPSVRPVSPSIETNHKRRLSKMRSALELALAFSRQFEPVCQTGCEQPENPQL